ncbi:hypothetical protein SRHO_G00184050 [Serrasalmus rhombeus]
MTDPKCPKDIALRRQFELESEHGEGGAPLSPSPSSLIYQGFWGLILVLEDVVLLQGPALEDLGHPVSEDEFSPFFFSFFFFWISGKG